MYICTILLAGVTEIAQHVRMFSSLAEGSGPVSINCMKAHTSVTAVPKNLLLSMFMQTHEGTCAHAHTHIF